MKRKGFTLIELIVVMAIIAILILLGAPKYKEYTKDAYFTRIMTNAKALENASSTYYMKNNDWPRLIDEAYTAEQLQSYAQEIYDKTGKEVVLDEDGKYYDIDYNKLKNYIKEPQGSERYILQNPIGVVYYLDNLTETGKTKIVARYNNSKGTSQEAVGFSYTGDIQEFEVPMSGKYLLEVWGASGEDFSGSIGGLGGYSKGEIELVKGEKLYVVVAGQAIITGNGYHAGGFNGGGSSRNNGAGGGATHIAKRTGLLKDLISYKEEVLIVAGGGGGGGSFTGGYGGGLIGGKGLSGNAYDGYGGTQSLGGVNAGNKDIYGVAFFGQGSNGPSYSGTAINGTGGGGGYYGGGYGARYYTYTSSGAKSYRTAGGGGGSSYIDGVVNGITDSGVHNGHGKALITYVGAE